MKKIMALLLAVVMIIGVLPAAFAAGSGYPDVEGTEWFANYVQHVTKYKMMNGTEKGFEPEGTCTRAMAATVIYRLEDPVKPTGNSKFTDLTDDWYKDAVLWAEQKGVVNGKEDNKFDPNGELTRQELVTMLYRYAGKPEVKNDNLKDFPDHEDVDSWAKDAFNWAVENKIIGGSDGKLLPKDNATRAQFAKIVSVYNVTFKLKLEHVEAKAPTCTEDGTKEYWKAEDGTIYTDELALNSAYKNRVPVDPHLGHKYENGVCTICKEKLAEEGDIVLFHTNDVHCHIDKGEGYAQAAALKQQAKLAVGDKGGVLLVDAGDAIQGTPYGSLDQGKTIINLMRLAGYDVATFGNHEFDYGMERTLALKEEAGAATDKDHPGTPFSYVCCNFYKLKEDHKTADTTVVDPYKIYTFGDKKVAVVGIATPESFTKSTPAYFQDKEGNYIYGLAEGNKGQDLYDSVQTAVDAAKAEGANYVVALAHTGVDKASEPWTADEVIKNTNGIDVYIDGHSHTNKIGEVENKDGEKVVYSQTGTAYNCIGKIVIDKDGKITATHIDAVQNLDEATAKANKAWIDSVEEELGETVAKSNVDFYINNPETHNRMIRNQETNLGDFTTDALRYYFTKIDPINGKPVDFAIMNGGGIRADMPKGDVTYKTMMTVHTFGNMATVIELSGQKVLDALEWGARTAGPEGKECGGFLQTSGLTYEIHTYIPDGCKTDDKGNWIGHDGEYRVKNVMIGGKPLDLDKTYTMAGQGYTLKSGGDGFTMFKGCAYPKDEVRIDYEVLVDYAKSFPVDEKTKLPTIDAKNSVLGTDYSDFHGEGRIKLVNEKPISTDGYALYNAEAKAIMSTKASNSHNSSWKITEATLSEDGKSVDVTGSLEPAVFTVNFDEKGNYYTFYREDLKQYLVGKFEDGFSCLGYEATETTNEATHFLKEAVEGKKDVFRLKTTAKDKDGNELYVNFFPQKYDDGKLNYKFTMFKYDEAEPQNYEFQLVTVGKAPVPPVPPTPEKIDKEEELKPAELNLTDVAMYNALDGGKVFTSTEKAYTNKAGETVNQYASADAVLKDGKVEVSDKNVVLFTVATKDGITTLKNKDGKFLSYDGKDMAFVDAENEYTQFELLKGANDLYLRSKNAKYVGKDGEKNQYLRSAYGSFHFQGFGNDAEHQDKEHLAFYEVKMAEDKPVDPPTPTGAEYTLTAYADIKDGTEVVVVAPEFKAAIKAEEGHHNIMAVLDVTVADNKITSNVDPLCVWTLNKVGDNFTLKNGTNYLGEKQDGTYTNIIPTPDQNIEWVAEAVEGSTTNYKLKNANTELGDKLYVSIYEKNGTLNEYFSPFTAGVDMQFYVKSGEDKPVDPKPDPEPTPDPEPVEGKWAPVTEIADGAQLIIAANHDGKIYVKTDADAAEEKAVANFADTDCWTFKKAEGENQYYIMKGEQYLGKDSSTKCKFVDTAAEAYVFTITFEGEVATIKANGTGVEKHPDGRQLGFNLGDKPLFRTYYTDQKGATYTLGLTLYAKAA